MTAPTAAQIIANAIRDSLPPRRHQQETTMWKPEAGKPSMVMVHEVHKNGDVFLQREAGFGIVIPRVYLHPLPSASPLEAAEKWTDECPWGLVGDLAHMRHLATVVDALRASRQPPAPMAELRKAWDYRNNKDFNMDPATERRIEAAIRAMEGE